MGLIGFIERAPAWQFWAAVLGVTLLAFWWCFRGFRNLQRARLVEDTPTARIRSAPQGFVELAGRAVSLPGEPILTPLSGRACVWYAYRIERWLEPGEPLYALGWFESLPGEGEGGRRKRSRRCCGAGSAIAGPCCGASTSTATVRSIPGSGAWSAGRRKRR